MAHGNRATALLSFVALGLGCSSAPPDPAPRDVDLTEEVGTAASALGTCIFIQRPGVSGAPVADAMIVQAQGATNFGANAVLQAGGPGTDDWRTLIRFDLSGVPAGSQITSADVLLAATSAPNGTINLHGVTSAWVESTVTWNNFASAFSSTIVVSAPAAAKLDLPITALSQGWLDDPASNHGVLLEETSSTQSRWTSSESANPKTRPALRVCYLTPNLCAGVVCTASDQCHAAGACDPTTGACSSPAVADGTACDDGDACTQSDGCVAGHCTGGASTSCDDGIACTVDTCDPVLGCQHDATACGCDAQLTDVNMIAYDVRTTQLSADADFSQAAFPATMTIDGVIDESMWAVDPLEALDHYIFWTFGAGATSTNALQILTDFHFNHPHHLIHFSLDYTTDPSPTLASNFSPLHITCILGFSADLADNVVSVTTTSQDYRIFYAPLTATAIRVHTFPNAGDHSNGNFTLNEVSFRTTPSGGSM